MKLFQSKQYTEIKAEQFHLGEPKKIKHGVYLSNIQYDDSVFLIQLPEMVSPNGFVYNGKNKVIQLEISPTHQNHRENLELLKKSIQHVETIVKGKILENAQEWFDNDMTLEDIEYFYNGIFEKNTLKCGVSENSLANPLLIIDENELVRNESDVKEKPCICVVQIKGLRFTSTSFKLETVIRQIMILEKGNLFSKCLIKRDENGKTERRDNVSRENTPKTETDYDDAISLHSGTDSNMDSDNESVYSEHTNDSGEDVGKNREIKEDEETEVNIETEVKIENNENEKHRTKENMEDISNIEIAIDTDPSSNDSVNLERNENTLKSLQPQSGKAEGSYKSIENKESLVGGTQDKAETIERMENTENTKNPEKSTTSQANNLEEFELVLSSENIGPPVQLKKKDEVYYEIYKEVRRKARMAKKAAMIAYLEAKHIKNTYMLDVVDDDSSDEEDLDNLSEISYDDLDENLEEEI